MILPNEGKAFKRLCSTENLSREDWLNERDKDPCTGEWRLGGSDMPKILRVSSWGGWLTVFCDKMHLTPRQEDNERMLWGRLLEDVVAREFSNRTGLEVQRVNSILGSIEHPWAVGNIDRRIVGEPVGYEGKAVGEWAGRFYEANEFYPDHYCQCQHYMMVTGWAKWYLAVLIGGQRLVWREVPRDEEMIRQIIRAGSEFIGYLQRGEEPPAGSSDGDALAALYPQEEAGAEVALSLSLLEQFEVYDDCCLRIKMEDAKKDLATNQIRQALGEAEKGICGDRIATWKCDKNGKRRLTIK